MKHSMDFYLSLTDVQVAAYNELNGDLAALRFTNEYQVVAWVATNNVDVSLRLNSTDRIVDYFNAHRDELPLAISRVLTRNYLNQAIVIRRGEVISSYPAIIAELSVRLESLQIDILREASAECLGDFDSKSDNSI